MIHCIPSGPFATNAYIIGCPATHKAAIIDPGVDSFDAINELLEKQSFLPEKILLTHSHWDHIGDAAKCKEHFKIPISIHPEDLPNLEKPGSDHLPLMQPIPPAKADHLLSDGDTLSIGNTSWKVIHTPGHSPGGICFYNEENAILISGDTLFQGSIGNISFPTSNPDAMWKSLKKLSALPPETQVYPGHGPSTTLAEESWLPQAQQIFGPSARR